MQEGFHQTQVALGERCPQWRGQCEKDEEVQSEGVVQMGATDHQS